MERAFLALFLLLAAAYQVPWIPLGCMCEITVILGELEANPGDTRRAGGRLLVYVVVGSTHMENFTF